jgi:Xaa-Pro aminopeptidase
MTGAQEIAEKLRRVRAFLEARGAAGLLLATPGNFAWITGGGRNHVSLHGDQGCGAALITGDGACLVANNIEAARLRLEETAAPECFETREFPWWSGSLEAVAAELPGLVADVDLPGAARLTPAEGTALRNPLLAPEQERFARLGEHVAVALTHAALHCRPGLSEHQLAGLATGVLLDLGADPLVALVAADERARLRRHPLPTGARLERLALLVITARRHGLHVSASRMVHFGPPPEDLRRRHLAAARVEAAFRAATTPGNDLGAVFAAGAAAYAAEGYPEEWRLHHQGGPTGYQARDALVRPDSPGQVLPGQAFAWNPTVDGTKSEDTFLAPAGPGLAPRLLSRTPDLPEIEWGGQVLAGIVER